MMETYFNDVAALLDRSLAPGEIHLCRFDAEVSDFVRMNRGKVRQPGSVSQRYLSLRLIRGKRHAERSLTVTGDLAQDRADIVGATRRLCERVGRGDIGVEQIDEISFGAALALGKQL